MTGFIKFLRREGEGDQVVEGDGHRGVPQRLDPASRSARSCRAIPGTLGPPAPRTLLGAIGRRGSGGGQLVGRGWPSLATQAIGKASHFAPEGARRPNPRLSKDHWLEVLTSPAMDVGQCEVD